MTRQARRLRLPYGTAKEVTPAIWHSQEGYACHMAQPRRLRQAIWHSQGGYACHMAQANAERRSRSQVCIPVLTAAYIYTSCTFHLSHSHYNCSLTRYDLEHTVRFTTLPAQPHTISKQINDKAKHTYTHTHYSTFLRHWWSS